MSQVSISPYQAGRHYFTGCGLKKSDGRAVCASNFTFVLTLVIRGEIDILAPVEQEREMHESFASDQKRILTIPGAGHNDLLYQGINEYFMAIREFVGHRRGKWLA